MTKIVEVPRKGCVLLDDEARSNGVTMVAAEDLFEDVALKFIVKARNTGGVCINIEPHTLNTLLEEYLSSSENVNITITGGDGKLAWLCCMNKILSILPLYPILGLCDTHGFNATNF